MLRNCNNCGIEFDAGKFCASVKSCSEKCKLESKLIDDISPKSKLFNGSKCKTIETTRVDKGGYKEIRYKKKTTRAHRAYYMEFVGSIPKDKPIIRHLCNNPACVNVNHLQVGTHKDNSNDMTSANRQACGIKCGMSKLNEDQVKEIKKLGNTVIGAELAARYNVNRSTIYRILNDETWKNVG